MTTNTTACARARRWAAGNLTQEAGVELLIRSGLVTDDCRWVTDDGYIKLTMLRLDAGSDCRANRVLVDIAESFIHGHAVCLADAIPALELADVPLVAAAVSHAAGCHVFHHNRIINGQLTTTPPAALVEWPA